MFGRQRGAKTRIAGLAQLPYGALPAALRHLPVRAAAAQPMHDSAIAFGSQPSLQPSHVAISQPQPVGRFDLF